MSFSNAIDPRVCETFQTVANVWGDKFLAEVLVPALSSGLRVQSIDPEELQEALINPFRCLHMFFAHYAFSRRGRDRDQLSTMAVTALRRVADADTFEKVLQQEDGSAVWEEFERVCAERGKKSNEQLNRGLIAGFVELAQEIYRMDGEGSISAWIEDAVNSTRRIEPVFMRLVDIRGVGPKTTANFLRDMVLVLGIEDRLEHVDRLYIQPIDRWSRLFAKALVDDLDTDDPADWIIAGKLSKYCRLSGVSGIKFNMGASYFGLRVVHEPGRFKDCLKTLVPAPR